MTSLSNVRCNYDGKVQLHEKKARSTTRQGTASETCGDILGLDSASRVDLRNASY